jgi:two-component system chemotaxis response regulator CheV
MNQQATQDAQASSIDDELIRLVTSNADTASQYVIFRSGNDVFAINVSKVEELIEYKTLSIANNPDAAGIAYGTTKIRQNMVSMVDFDGWLGKVVDESHRRLVMVCYYGGKRIGLVIEHVIGIMNVDANRLIDHSEEDRKMQYITEVVVGNEQRLCMVFDTDVLLTDVFPSLQGLKFTASEHNSEQQSIWAKHILVAEDSRIVQAAIRQMLEAKNANFHMFINGQDLWEHLVKHEDEMLPALIISDVEMPVMDGLALLKSLKAHPNFKQIPVVINTNMARGSIAEQARRNGAEAVILKPDMDALVSAVESILSGAH